LHAASENKRVDQAVKCIFATRPDYATAAWDILCERQDVRSFARYISLLDDLMLRQHLGHSISEYVHFMRQTYDNFNETCETIAGFAVIHPHNLGLLMLRGINHTGHFGQAKQCVITAFDTNYLLSADEEMANILHLAPNMDDELPDPALTTRDAPAPPISAFVGVGRGSNNGRGHNTRGTRGGRGLRNKCSACGSLNHILSSCAASNDAILKWTLAKRKMTIHKYGTPRGHALAHAALLSDVPTNDLEVMPTLEECTDEYDDNEVSVPFSSVAFSSSLALGRGLSQFFGDRLRLLDQLNRVSQ
jgi:hypothetical protein